MNLDLKELQRISSAINNIVKYIKDDDKNFENSVFELSKALETLYLTPSKIKSVLSLETRTYQYLNQKYTQSTGDFSVEKKYLEIKELIQSTITQFDEYKNLNLLFSNSINNQIESIESIHSIMNDMSSLTKKIKLFSINSIITSGALGSKGMGFKSISYFIIELSDTIQKSVHQVESYKEKTSSTQYSLKKQIFHLIDNFYSKKIDQFLKKVSKKLDKVHTQIIFITKIYQNNYTTINSIQQDFYQIVEDKPSDKINILFNYYINLLEFVQAFDSLTPTSINSKNFILQRLTSIIFILKKQKSYQEKAFISIETLENLLKTYQKVFTRYFNFNQNQKFLLNFMSQPHKDKPPLLDDLFNNLYDILLNILEIIEEESLLKEKIATTFNEMEKMYQEGLKFFNSFEKFFVTMNNINILAQIEFSKQDLDYGENRGAKKQFIEILKQIQDFNAKVKTNVRYNIKTLLSEVDGFKKSKEEQILSLKKIKNTVTSKISQVKFLEQEFKKQVTVIYQENLKTFSLEKELAKVVEDSLYYKDKVSEEVGILLNFLNKESYFFNSLAEKYKLNIVEDETNPYISAYIKSQARFKNRI